MKTTPQPPKTPSYQTRIAIATAALNLPPGTLAVARVKHVRGCPHNAGRPVCRCVPVISIELPTGTVHVLPDGSVHSPPANQP